MGKDKELVKKIKEKYPKAIERMGCGCKCLGCFSTLLMVDETVHKKSERCQEKCHKEED